MRLLGLKPKEAKNELTLTKKQIEMEAGSFKHDYEDLELTLQKIQGETDNKNHQIRVINDEIAHQEEIINKTNKEKKQLQEVSSKNNDEFSGVEERAAHLNNIKSKLESTLGEIGDALNREKKTRLDLERAKRKVEGDVKPTMECVADL